MKYAVEGGADDVEALDALETSMKKWFNSVGATVLERMRDHEDVTVSFLVRSRKDLGLHILDADLPGKVEVEGAE
jgi:hypothetical protein